MTLDHSALWSMYASLEELRGKIGHVLKCAIQMSKVAWSNVIAKRCSLLPYFVQGTVESNSVGLVPCEAVLRLTTPCRQKRDRGERKRRKERETLGGLVGS